MIIDNIDSKFGNILFPLFLAAITLLIFSVTFSADFVYDDFPVLVHNADVRQWHFWDLWRGLTRGTRTLSLMVDYHMFGDSPMGYHVQNIGWHIASTILLYYFLIKVSGDRVLSFIAALIFAVHPVHVETVANISNRKDSLCMTFSLSAIICFINFLSQVRLKKWTWFAGCLASWLFALYSKQVAIAVPLILISYEYLFLDEKQRFLMKRPPLLLAVGALATAAGIYFLWGIKYAKGGYIGALSMPVALLIAGEVFWGYIKLLLFPFSLSPDHIVEIHSYYNYISLIISWAGLFGLVMLVFVLPRDKALLAFGITWMIINYIPVSAPMPLSYFMADRYMYIPSAGACMVFAFFMRRINLKPPLMGRIKGDMIGLTLLVLIVVCYSVKTVNYSKVWLNKENLWTYTLKVSPNSVAAHNNMGDLLNKSGRYKEAVEYLRKAILLKPEASGSYLNLGVSYYKMGHIAEAILNFKTAIEKDGSDAKPYYSLALIDKERGDFIHAISNLNMAIKLEPDYTDSFSLRGLVHALMGNNVMAVRDLSKAIELDPLNYKALENRGHVYYNKGLYKEAIKDLRASVDINQSNGQAFFNLGIIYLEMGKKGEARECFEKALNLGLADAKKYLEM